MMVFVMTKKINLQFNLLSQFSLITLQEKIYLEINF